MSDDPGAHLVSVGDRSLRVSNLDKILYPASETTKGEVLHYYAVAAPRILRQMQGRLVTRVRFPHGVNDLKFFEKNIPQGAPGWISRVASEGVVYPLIDSVAGLTYFANLASLEFHTPQWRVVDAQPVAPDRLVIDLDPGAPAGLDECAQVALIMKDLFDSVNLPSVAVTSGSKGMQVYAGVDGTRSSAELRTLSRALAEKLAELRPELVVAKMTKSLRPGKVFLDWSQNTGFKTTITPWSLRGRSTPTVATPRDWQEILDGVRRPGTLAQLHLDDVLEERLDRPDPMDALGE